MDTVVIVALVVVLVIVLIGAAFLLKSPAAAGGSSTGPAAGGNGGASKVNKWDAVRNRNGETNEKWATRIFGPLRMNPAQEMEGAIFPLLALLEGKEVLDASAALEFAKVAFHWYPNLTPQSGMYNGATQTLIGF